MCGSPRDFVLQTVMCVRWKPAPTAVACLTASRLPDNCRCQGVLGDGSALNLRTILSCGCVFILSRELLQVLVCRDDLLSELTILTNSAMPSPKRRSGGSWATLGC